MIKFEVPKNACVDPAGRLAVAMGILKLFVAGCIRGLTQATWMRMDTTIEP